MGNQALNPCLTAIDDEMRANQNADAAKGMGSPKHGNKLLNRIIGIAASSLSGGQDGQKGRKELGGKWWIMIQWSLMIEKIN